MEISLVVVGRSNRNRLGRCFRTIRGSAPVVLRVIVLITPFALLFIDGF